MHTVEHGPQHECNNIFFFIFWHFILFLSFCQAIHKWGGKANEVCESKGEKARSENPAAHRPPLLSRGLAPALSAPSHTRPPRYSTPQKLILPLRPAASVRTNLSYHTCHSAMSNSSRPLTAQNAWSSLSNYIASPFILLQRHSCKNKSAPHSFAFSKTPV